MPITMTREQWEQIVFEGRVAFTGCTNIWDNDKLLEVVAEVEALQTALARAEAERLEIAGKASTRVVRAMAAEDAQEQTAIALAAREAECVELREALAK